MGPSVAITAINDYDAAMTSITIRRLPETTKQRLRVRAAIHGRSMEEEAREILRVALELEPLSNDLGRSFHERFAELGGVELELPARGPGREPPDFS